MAPIRVNFSTALFALSFVICLLVALLFVDRSRQEAEEAGVAHAKAGGLGTTSDKAASLVGTAAMTNPTERSGITPSASNSEPPVLVISNGTQTIAPATPEPVMGTPAAAELPIDPRHVSQVKATATPELTAAQRARLSPEALARQMTGRTKVPASTAAQVAPDLAVPEGVAYSAPKNTPRPTMAPQVIKTPMPIISNASGVADAMKHMGPGSAFGVSGADAVAKDSRLPFSQQGTISTERLRATLAGNANLDPTTLLPVEETASPAATLGAMSNAGSGWAQTQEPSAARAMAAATPDSTIVIKGGQRQGTSAPTQSTASVISPLGQAPASFSAGSSAMAANGALPPPPVGVDPLSGVMSNQPAVPSPTPNYGEGFGTAPPAGAAAMGAGNKWNLPPAPSLPGAPIRDEAPKSVGTSKTTLLPIDEPGAQAAPFEKPSALAASAPAPGGIGELPLDVAMKAGALDQTNMASVNERTLSGTDASRRADALAILDGKKLDADRKQMMMRSAAENWAEMVCLSEEAQRQGVTVTDDEALKLLAESPLVKLDAWQSALKKAGYSEAEVRAELRDLALAEKLVRANLDKNDDEQKLRAIYDKNPQLFQVSKRLKVQEITKARPADANTAQNVEREMEKLQRQAASGTDFGLLAMQSSEAPSKALGGQLGWLDDKSNITEQTAQALLPLKPGQVSGVVADAKGYHIYKLLEVDEPKPGFEVARKRVLETLRGEVYIGLLAAAESHSKIEIAHKQKNRKAVADGLPQGGKSAGSVGTAKSSGRKAAAIGRKGSAPTQDEALAELMASKRDRSTSNENGRASVRSKNANRGKANEGSTKETAGRETANAPAPTVVDLTQQGSSLTDAIGGEQPVNAPPGFGGASETATLPATPNPATASANQPSRLKNPFSGIMSKFQKPTSTAQQQ